MAEYCAQCAKQYGMSNGFINECKPNYLANVICEGCGVIQVNVWAMIATMEIMPLNGKSRNKKPAY